MTTGFHGEDVFPGQAAPASLHPAGAMRTECGRVGTAGGLTSRILALVLLTLVAGCAGAAPAAATPLPKLDGAFLWVGRAKAGWSAERWAKETELMRLLGMKTIIVSAAVDDNVAIYPTAIPGLKPCGNDPLRLILAAADARGMEVHIGLVGSRRWWSETGDAWLDELTSTSNAVATELYARYRSSPSLRGFYLPPEIDNMRWVNEPVRARLVARYLRPVTDHIRRLDRSLVTSQAPFFNRAYQPPAGYGTWWEKTLRETPNLDLLIPQDGIGAGHADLPGVVAYFTALRAACKATSRTLWADLEIFGTAGGGGFAPAEMGRIAAQLAAEAPLVDRVVFWEWTTYISPSRSRASRGLCADYVKYLGLSPPPALAAALAPTPDELAPPPLSRGKPYTLSAAPSAQYPDAPGKLTDGDASPVFQAQVGWAKPGAAVTVTIDLQATCALGRIDAFFMRSDQAAVGLPGEIRAAVSTDGKAFADLGRLIPQGGDDEESARFSLAGTATGRFVRLTVSHPTNEWVMISDVRVHGSAGVP